MTSRFSHTQATRNYNGKEFDLWQHDCRDWFKDSSYSGFCEDLAVSMNLAYYRSLDGTITPASRVCWRNQWVRDKLVCPILLNGSFAGLYWLPFSYSGYLLVYGYDPGVMHWVSWSFFKSVYDTMWAYQCGLAMYTFLHTTMSDDQAASMKPFLNRMIESAYKQGATDIHIAYTKQEASIYFRLAGSLSSYQILSHNMATHLSACLKVASGFCISKSGKPQEGRFSFGDMSIRISIIPSLYGEAIALRLPRPHVSIHWTDQQDALVIQALSHTAGLILVVGPTGVGKSTTLYKMLSLINSRCKRIMSLEDPIERSLDGVHQVEIDPQNELDFYQALPAILRQDPDVICVGEIRDSKTAKLCAEATLTGHLVLSSMHAANCYEACLRFKSLIGDKAEDLQDVQIRLVVNQRLVPVYQKTECSSANQTREKGIPKKSLWPLWFMTCDAEQDQNDMECFWQQAQVLLGRGQAKYSEIVSVLGPPKV